MILKPWTHRGIAFVLGTVGALAFAPTFIFPALLLSFSGMWFLLEQEIVNNASFPKIFWLGWWFGLGHFTAGLYWIAFALAVDLETFWWLIPFALLGIPSILALFTGLSFVLTKAWPYTGMSRAFAFAALWVGVEWLRGHLFTGFPWNLAGYGWAFSHEIIQMASVVGTYGLSLLALLMAVSLGYFVGARPFERNIALTIYLIPILCWVWGKNRLDHPDVLSAPSLSLRLVQPSIPQTLKWDLKQQEAHLQQLLKMTQMPSSLPLKAVIWPESAVAFFLEQDSFRRLLIAEALPKGALLFTGALRKTPPGKTPVELWNSLLVLNDQGDIVTHYDKAHLVPFGEYIPFRQVLDSLFGKGSIKKITAGAMDFTPGPGPETTFLPTEFPSFSGLICYEVIFPKAVVNSEQTRPGWLINVTNDAWYGNTSGPYQHLEIARFRAIEEGIPLVRAANSGISSVFDAYGGTVGRINLNQIGVRDILLPAPTRFIPFYGQWGDWITLALIMGTLGVAWIFSRFKIT